MQRVALVTCAAYPDLSDDCRRVVPALAARGLEAVPATWTDPGVDWGSFAAVVVRSTWDYHRRRDEFLSWISRLEAMGAPLWNPPAVLRDNSSKHYLRRLEKAGVPVPTTAWAMRGSGRSLASCAAEIDAAELVFKPAVSADAFGTRRLRRDELGAHEAEFAALLDAGDMLVQPYLAAIATEGEHSLVHFDGRFSHAIVKRPKSGDFRVQPNHGGTAHPSLAEPGLRAVADAAIGALGFETLYARVDLVREAGRVLVQEVELTEPSLFLATAPGAEDRFAEAVSRRVS